MLAGTAVARHSSDPSYGIYAYTAREWDPEVNLYYYRARYYDPKVGRFVGEDPLGVPSIRHLYAYVSSDPVRNADPLGLSERCVWVGASAIGAVGWGGQASWEAGWCRDDCANWKMRTRFCTCFAVGGGACAGVGLQFAGAEKKYEGWTVCAKVVRSISASGSGITPTGGGVGPGWGVFYSWCDCNYL
jgi:RHS repeat-associated protein